MNILESFIQTVPNAGPQAKSQVENAQQRLDLLRARGFKEEADIFAQGLINKIQSKNFSTMDRDFEEIAKLYSSNIKGEGATRPKDTTAEDTAKKEALTAATIAELNQLAKKSAESGNQFDPSLVESISTLAKVDPDKAREVAKSSLPILEVKEADKAPKKSAADITFEQNANSAIRYSNELYNTIKEGGTWESYLLGDPKIQARLNQLPYQMAIAYAKTVDPSSVAREGEVAAAQKYLIPLGLTKRQDVALQSVENFRRDIVDQMQSYKKATGSDLEIPEIPKVDEKKEETVSGINAYFNKFTK
jgi:hypothetical protein